MKKILLTGGSGFLGKYILGAFSGKAELITLGRSKSNTIRCTITEEIPPLPPGIDTVIHVAGKAHVVPRTNDEAAEFFSVNLQGTVNLCRALEQYARPQYFIFISSVAVYGIESGNEIVEDTPLLGKTPYARSKIAAEEYLINWCSKQNIPLLILRLPLLAGKYPPGNLGAMIRAIRNGRYLSLGGGVARKSMVLAEDVARLLSELQSPVSGIFHLTDGQHPSFRELEKGIAGSLNKSAPPGIPLWFARILGKSGDLLGNRFPLNSDRIDKMTHSLTFNDEKARKQLGWNPKHVLEHIEQICAGS